MLNNVWDIIWSLNDPQLLLLSFVTCSGIIISHYLSRPNGKTVSANEAYITKKELNKVDRILFNKKMSYFIYLLACLSGLALFTAYYTFG